MSPDALIFIYVAVSSAVASLLTALFTYLGTRRKSMSSGFISILEANERFRNEVKDDLRAARLESEDLREDLMSIEKKHRISIEKISELQVLIIDYQSEIQKLKSMVQTYQSEITLLRSVIDDYKIEIGKLRNELKILNEKNN